jgi:hypothetical protein
MWTPSEGFFVVAKEGNLKRARSHLHNLTRPLSQPEKLLTQPHTSPDAKFEQIPLEGRFIKAELQETKSALPEVGLNNDISPKWRVAHGLMLQYKRRARYTSFRCDRESH